MTFLGLSPRSWAWLCVLLTAVAVLLLRSLSKRGPLGAPLHRLIGASAGISLLAGTVFVALRAEKYIAWSNAIFLAIPLLIMGGLSLMVVYRMLFAGRETAQRDLQQLAERLGQ